MPPTRMLLAWVQKKLRLTVSAELAPVQVPPLLLKYVLAENNGDEQLVMAKSVPNRLVQALVELPSGT
jgi:hypothetical protein